MKPFRNIFGKFKKIKRPIANGKAFFVTRKNAHEHGMVADLVGKGFAQKNERLMALRKKIVTEMGLTPKTIQVLDKLFRLRKAGTLSSRGIVSEVAAKKMIKFLQERKADGKAHGKSKKQLEVFDFAIGEFKLAIKKGQVDLSMANEIKKSRAEYATNSHYVFDIKGKNKIKSLEVNPFASMLVEDIAQELIELSLGNNYQKFVLTEQRARRAI